MLLPPGFKPAPGLLANHNILVTGAGDGIGRESAITFARCGARVLLLGRTTAKLEGVYDEIVTAGGPEPAIVPLNLSTLSASDLDELSNAINTNIGPLHGLLHNASIIGDRVPISHYDPVTWQNVMQVNLNAVFLLTRTLLPALLLPETASILFTSSSVGRAPRAFWGAYAVSKYAVEGFATLLADELENTSAVRVNTVNPGATRTAMRATAYPNEDPGSVKGAADLMPLYVYLMSDASLEVRGERIDADA